MLLEIDNVIVTTELVTEFFCCDLAKCHGRCCIEGDAGAPVDIDEITDLERAADTILTTLAPEAQQVIQQQGVVYPDIDGELVTSIVNGKDCVFTTYRDDCCYCALECAYRQGTIPFRKPISCALYPLREKTFRDGSVGLSYHQWHICQPARVLGQQRQIRLYEFLREPLIARFSQQWYAALAALAPHIINHKP